MNVYFECSIIIIVYYFHEATQSKKETANIYKIKNIKFCRQIDKFKNDLSITCTMCDTHLLS